MKITSFEEIESWKEARCLVKDVYLVTGNCRDYGFRDQMQRAAISVMSNIAEGFDRGSNKEFMQFLIVARGSVSEVKSLAYAGSDIGCITNEEMLKIVTRCTALSSMINGFLRYLKTTDRQR